MWRLAYVVACFALLLGSDGAQEKPAGQRFAPGEVIVRFSANSRAAQLSAHALTESNPSDAALNSYIQSVSSELSIPLEVKRFASGGNVILAVRQVELAADLSQRLRNISSVEDTHLVSEKGAAASTIGISFKENSREAETLAQAAQKGVESSADVEVITAKLEQECRVPLNACVSSSRQLLVTPDLQRLTLEVAARLQKRTDVEYAQPNFIRYRTTGNRNVQQPQ